MATRYWRGGTGTWDSATTTNWSATSGGAGGATVPTAVDEVIFNTASGSGNYTVTVSGNASCNNLTIAGPTTGTLSFDGFSAWIRPNGNLTITPGANSVYWRTGPGISWASANTSYVNTNGLTMNNYEINNTAANVVMTGNIVTELDKYTWIRAGTLTLNDRHLLTGILHFGLSNTRTINYGNSGRISLTGNNTTIANCGTLGTLTTTGSFSFYVPNLANTGTRTIQFGTAGGPSTGPNLYVTGGTDNVAIQGTYTHIDTTGFSGNIPAAVRTVLGNVVLGANTIIVDTGSGTVMKPTANSTIITNGVTVNFPVVMSGSGNLVFNNNTNVRSLSHLTGNVYLANGVTLNTGAYTSNAANGTIRYFDTLGGTINLNGTGTVLWIANTGWSSNLATFNITANTAVARTSNVSVFANSNSLPNIPDVRIGAGTGNGTVDIYGQYGNLDFRGSDITITPTQSLSALGNVFLGSNTKVVATTGRGFVMDGYGNKTFEANGVTFGLTPYFNITATSNGTITLVGNVTFNTGSVNYPVSHNYGTFDLNGYVVNAPSFSTNGSGARYMLANAPGSRLNLTGTTGQLWGYTSGGTYNVVGTVYATSNGTGKIFRHHSLSGGSNVDPLNLSISGSGADVSSLDGHYANLDFANYAGNITSSTARYVYYDFILPNAVGISSGGAAMVFAGGNMVVNIARPVGIPLQMTGNVTLANNITQITGRAMAIAGGTTNFNNFNVTTATLTVSAGNLTLGNGTINVMSAGFALNLSNANSTIVANSSTILFSNAGSASRTLLVGNNTLNNVVLSGTAANTLIQFSGNGTFNSISSNFALGANVTFEANSVTTLNNFAITGTSAGQVKIGTTVANQWHTLSLTSGIVSGVDYLNVSYSNAYPTTSTWYPGTNSVDGGYNTGWIFSLGSSSNFFLVF